MNRFVYALLSLLFFTHAAYAGEADISAAMKKKFPYAKLISVNKTPYLGLYEVVFDNQLVYTDEKMTYLFSGNIIDMHTMKNLTKAREKQLYPSVFAKLPLDLALKMVKGDGSRKLAVFTDPNCSYCKKLEKEMIGLKDATVYFFIYPILPGSEALAKTLWCTKDRLKTWENHMLNGIDPTSGETCDTSAFAKVAKLASQLHVSATPTILFEDGTLHAGTLPLDQLENQLTASAAAK